MAIFDAMREYPKNTWFLINTKISFTNLRLDTMFGFLIGRLNGIVTLGTMV
jgi:hypothetical protein